MAQSRTSLVVVVLISAITSFAVGYLTKGPVGSGQPQDMSGSAYRRVMSSHSIRVGYVSYPPGTIVDAAGRNVTGIFPDLIREIGKSTGLEVQFTEEVGWATLVEGLQTDRYDIIGGIWDNPERGKVTTSSIPAYYSGIGVWVRPEENRFSSSERWASINSPSVRIGAIDGSTPLEISHSQFPKATLITYPNLTTESQLFLDLIQGRIDVFFAEPSQGLLFLKNNPGKVRNLASSDPIRVFPDVFLMREGEFQLKTLIDTALFDLQGSGVVDSLILKYEPVDGAFYRVALPYSQPGRRKTDAEPATR